MGLSLCNWVCRGGEGGTMKPNARRRTLAHRVCPKGRNEVQKLGLVVLINLVVLSSAFAAEGLAGPAVTVLVFNFRQVPHRTLVKAENKAGRIFEQAGVRATWRDCPTGNEPCLKGPGRVLMLALTSGPVQNKFVDASPAMPTFGTIL